MIQALFLDLLNEDRKYSRVQLQEMAETYLQQKSTEESLEILRIKISKDLNDLFEKNLLK